MTAITVTYKIVFSDNTGSLGIDAIAATVQGDWHNTVSNYDGEGHDFGMLDVLDENAEYLEEILDADENVISYRCS